MVFITRSRVLGPHESVPIVLSRVPRFFVEFFLHFPFPHFPFVFCLADDGNCLGWRDGPHQQYQWLTYNTALLRAHNFGSGLVAIGCQPGQQTRIGIYAKNSPEWVLAEQALYHFSMVLVPLYDTLGEDACIFVMDQG